VAEITLQRASPETRGVLRQGQTRIAQYLGIAQFLHGWALLHQDQAEAGLARSYTGSTGSC